MKCDASIGVLLADLHFPGARSLKHKRAPLNSLRDVVRGRFKASFSEVGGGDVWQLATVLVVLAASSPRQAASQLDDIERLLHARDYEVSAIRLKTVAAVEELWDIVC